MSLKNLFILFFVVGVSFTGFSQKINQLDANGKKTGVWKKLYPNGNVRYEGQFLADKEVGVFKFYNEDEKQPAIVKTYDALTNKAKVVYYQENGLQKSVGEMDGKNRIGIWLYYYPDGKTLLIEEQYKNGMLEGTFKSYFKNGKPSELLLYKNGKLNGVIKRYADNGVLLEDLTYTDGKLNGKANYFSLSGELISSGTYENDHKIGEWKNNSVEAK